VFRLSWQTVANGDARELDHGRTSEAVHLAQIRTAVVAIW
jgi:hypothetical protein